MFLRASAPRSPLSCWAQSFSPQQWAASQRDVLSASPMPPLVSPAPASDLALSGKTLSLTIFQNILPTRPAAPLLSPEQLSVLLLRVLSGNLSLIIALQNNISISHPQSRSHISCLCLHRSLHLASPEHCSVRFCLPAHS